jgi:hypothetical protein
MPNATASASHTSPTSGGAVELSTWKLKSPRRTPPRPAMPALSAKTMILVRSTRTPDAAAATSELRTASIARPEAERQSA